MSETRQENQIKGGHTWKKEIKLFVLDDMIAHGKSQIIDKKYSWN